MDCQFALDLESDCPVKGRLPWWSPTVTHDRASWTAPPSQWEVPLPGKFGFQQTGNGLTGAPPGLEMENGNGFDSLLVDCVPPIGAPNGRPKKREGKGKAQRRVKDASRGTAAGDKAAQPMTTVMVRNIACRYTKEQVMEFIDDLGLKGKYDFLYLPLNPVRRANLGYIFINFTTVEAVEECKQMLNGKSLGTSTTEKRCAVALARVQGQANITAHFRRKSVMRSTHAPVFVFDDNGEPQHPQQKQQQQPEQPQQEQEPQQHDQQHDPQHEQCQEVVGRYSL